MKMTFENLVSGKRNQEAVLLAKDISLRPEGRGITIFAGPTGCGKTHLVHAMKNAIEENGEYGKVMLMSCFELIEKVIDEINESGKKGISSEKFCEMHQAPVIILEEFEWSKKRPIARIVLERIMGIWEQKGSTVIVTSDKEISEWEVLSSEKNSVWIRLPDADMRREIVRKKSDEIGMKLTAEERKDIARKTRNGYQIEGMLKCLDADKRFVVPVYEKKVTFGLYNESKLQ